MAKAKKEETEKKTLKKVKQNRKVPLKGLPRAHPLKVRLLKVAVKRNF